MSDTPDQVQGTADGESAEEPLPPPHEKLMWVLVWGMGIICAIILIVWAGMLLFLN